jgi:uncharacterized membrane protein (UPF0127 family)
MRFPLDLYWLDDGGDVVRVDRRVPPWRIARCARACAVIELPSRADSQVPSPASPQAA